MVVACLNRTRHNQRPAAPAFFTKASRGRRAFHRTGVVHAPVRFFQFQEPKPCPPTASPKSNRTPARRTELITANLPANVGKAANRRNLRRTFNRLDKR